MSITKRLFKIVKSNINNVLNNDGDDSFDTKDTYEDDFMREAAEELDRELNRGKDVFEEEAWDEMDTDEYYEQSNRWYKKPFRDDDIAKSYAKLKVPYGSDFKTVKRAWRKLMKKYHPDLYAKDPQKMKEYNDICQEITKAYEILEKYLTEKG